MFICSVKRETRRQHITKTFGNSHYVEVLGWEKIILGTVPTWYTWIWIVHASGYDSIKTAQLCDPIWFLQLRTTQWLSWPIFYLFTLFLVQWSCRLLLWDDPTYCVDLWAFISKCKQGKFMQGGFATEDVRAVLQRTAIFFLAIHWFHVRVSPRKLFRNK